jgi:hypothetical protein
MRRGHRGTGEGLRPSPSLGGENGDSRSPDVHTAPTVAKARFLLIAICDGHCHQPMDGSEVRRRAIARISRVIPRCHGVEEANVHRMSTAVSSAWLGAPAGLTLTTRPSTRQPI